MAKKVPSEDLRREYEKKRPIFGQLRDEAVFILEHDFLTSGIKYHSLTSRIKAFESMANKAERNQLEQPLTEMHDLVGLRVVCLFLSDIERIAERIRDAFHVIEEDNKIEGQEIESFGYLSFHFKVEMKHSHSGPRYEAILKMPFEIQVRTIAMDAWAATSHYLDYKSDADVPSDLRRDFYALSGLFYVADKHFEMFFRSRQAAQKRIQKTLEQKNPLLDQEVNLDTLTAYLKFRLPERTPERDTPDIVSSLIPELRTHGYITIKQVDELVNKHWDWFTKREKERPPSRKDNPRETETRGFSGVGVVRIILNERVLGLK